MTKEARSRSKRSLVRWLVFVGVLATGLAVASAAFAAWTTIEFATGTIDTAAWGTANYTDTNNNRSITDRNEIAKAWVRYDGTNIYFRIDTIGTPALAGTNFRAVGGIDCNHDGLFNDRIVNGPDGRPPDYLLRRTERSTCIPATPTRAVCSRSSGRSAVTTIRRGRRQHRVGRAAVPALSRLPREHAPISIGWSTKQRATGFCGRPGFDGSGPVEPHGLRRHGQTYACTAARDLRQSDNSPGCSATAHATVLCPRYAGRAAAAIWK